jgi:hypothetical protein
VTPDLARRRSLLTAALGFALLRTRDGSAPPETEALRKWLDNWRGVAFLPFVPCVALLTGTWVA